MGDRITTFNDCPKCEGKGTFECYEALSSNMKLDECTECGYTVRYEFTEVDGVTEISEVRANTKPLRKLAPQSEAPSVDSQIDEVFDWLLALYIDTDDAYMVEEMEEDRPIFRAKINRLIIEAELRGFDKAFDSHDYDGLREYRAALSNNLSKGKDNE